MDLVEPDTGPRSAIGAEEIERRVVAVLDGLGVPYEIRRIDPAFADFSGHLRATYELYRVHAGPDRLAEMAPGWPAR